MEINNGVLQSENLSAPGTAGNWGPVVDRTISSGVLAVVGAKNIRVNAETGITDALTSITGVPIGTDIMIRAASGDTITVTHGSLLSLMGNVNNILNDVDDNMLLHANSATVLMEKSRANLG